MIENMVKKMGSIQLWCFWELHVERPWKSDGPLCHRRSAVQAAVPQWLLYRTATLVSISLLPVTCTTPKNEGFVEFSTFVLHFLYSHQ